VTACASLTQGGRRSAERDDQVSAANLELAFDITPL
jgi:hypothetical protein